MSHISTRVCRVNEQFLVTKESVDRETLQQSCGFMFEFNMSRPGPRSATEYQTDKPTTKRLSADKERLCFPLFRRRTFTVIKSKRRCGNYQTIFQVHIVITFACPSTERDQEKCNPL